VLLARTSAGVFGAVAVFGQVLVPEHGVVVELSCHGARSDPAFSHHERLISTRLQ